MEPARDILDIISTRKAAGEPFALATVVRTVAATAAKAGAKAVILPDGTISEGWIGGGCARAAVLKAAKDALADGRSRLVSVQPPDLLAEHGVRARRRAGRRALRQEYVPEPGHDGHFRRAGVAAAASDHLRLEPGRRRGRRSGEAERVCRHGLRAGGRAGGLRATPIAGSKAMRCRSTEAGARYVVVSTQGRGDEAALLAALAVDADYVAFVGSRKKAEALKAALSQRGVPAERLAKLKAPAGLDLGAITPDEIAISILAEIVAVRRSTHVARRRRAAARELNALSGRTDAAHLLPI